MKTCRQHYDRMAVKLLQDLQKYIFVYFKNKRREKSFQQLNLQFTRTNSRRILSGYTNLNLVDTQQEFQISASLMIKKVKSNTPYWQKA